MVIVSDDGEVRCTDISEFREALKRCTETGRNGFNLKLSVAWTGKCDIISLVISRYGSLVERRLPKPERRVRFPLSAFLFCLFSGQRTMKPV